MTAELIPPSGDETRAAMAEERNLEDDEQQATEVGRQSFGHVQAGSEEGDQRR